MDLQITPKKLSGAVAPPPSKSQAHRLLIAACELRKVPVADLLPIIRAGLEA